MADPPSDSVCHLLKIPAEVRQQVYQHLFADALIALDSLPIYGKDKRGVFCSEKRQCQTEVFQTCRRIRDEAQPIFIQSLTTRIESSRLNESHLPPMLQQDGRFHLRVLAFSFVHKVFANTKMDLNYFPNLQHLRLLQHPKATTKITRDFSATDISKAIDWLAEQATDMSLIEKLSSNLGNRGSELSMSHTGNKPKSLHQVYHNPERRYYITMEQKVRLILAIDGRSSLTTPRRCHQYCFIYQLDLDAGTQHLHYIIDYVKGTKLDLPQCLALNGAQ